VAQLSPKIRTWRAPVSFLAWLVPIIVSFWTSNFSLVALLLAIFAIAVTVFLFWPAITGLRIVHPKNAVLESPIWLYIFAVASLILVCGAFGNLYLSAYRAPRLLSEPEFSSALIEGKYFRISDLADPHHLIFGRTFENCWLYGPAVLAAGNNTDIQQCSFDAPADQVFTAVSTAEKFSVWINRSTGLQV
jgi:hypothetical protein